MSTKSTIAYGPKFHLYHDLLEDTDVYLELECAKCEASEHHVMVAIPFAVWELIRQYPAVDLSWADTSDDEIRRFVESEVRKRSEQYAEAGERERKIWKMEGLLIYGAVDTSQGAQIARGWEYFTRLRQRQAKIKQDIADLQQMQRRLDSE